MQYSSVRRAWGRDVVVAAVVEAIVVGAEVVAGVVVVVDGAAV